MDTSKKSANWVCKAMTIFAFLGLVAPSVSMADVSELNNDRVWDMVRSGEGFVEIDQTIVVDREMVVKRCAVDSNQAPICVIERTEERIVIVASYSATIKYRVITRSENPRIFRALKRGIVGIVKLSHKVIKGGVIVLVRVADGFVYHVLEPAGEIVAGIVKHGIIRPVRKVLKAIFGKRDKRYNVTYMTRPEAISKGFRASALIKSSNFDDLEQKAVSHMNQGACDLDMSEFAATDLSYNFEKEEYAARFRFKCK